MPSNVDLFDKAVDAVNTVLNNEYKYYITDAPIFLLSLQFLVSSNDEVEIKKNTSILLITINEIFGFFVMALKFIGFFHHVE